MGDGVRLGDFCWIEAVSRYGGRQYRPELVLGEGTAISDLVHISCLEKITIGRDCLIGSKVYIGDHSHGDLKMDMAERSMPPAKRPLGAVSPIEIGERVWIGDGAVILAGTRIAKESIVGANSVVRLRVDRPALIAGVPAKIIRYFSDGADAQLGGTDGKDGAIDN
jgi:acetyltransferase-like isoleucine patch superfamily enzyme